MNKWSPKAIYLLFCLGLTVPACISVRGDISATSNKRCFPLYRNLHAYEEAQTLSTVPGGVLLLGNLVADFGGLGSAAVVAAFGYGINRTLAYGNLLEIYYRGCPLIHEEESGNGA